MDFILFGDYLIGLVLHYMDVLCDKQELLRVLSSDFNKELVVLYV